MKAIIITQTFWDSLRPIVKRSIVDIPKYIKKTFGLTMVIDNEYCQDRDCQAIVVDDYEITQ